MSIVEVLAVLGGFAVGLAVAAAAALIIWRKAHAVGWLAGRTFLVRRKILQRMSVWIDGHPVDGAACIWIETNHFTRQERRSTDEFRLDGSAGCAACQHGPSEPELRVAPFYPQKTLDR
jgi:hypothetical protein